MFLISNVGAIPMVDSSNVTLSTSSSLSPSAHNPFDGIFMDIRSDSFNKAVLDRGATEPELDRRIVGAIIRVAAKIIEKVVSLVKDAINKDKKVPIDCSLLAIIG
ncbi:hypothetical protein H0H87_011351 [Tephrocybe sp. NHM501043]|nr:hypothetical protein H0H87_011351 [Tephrocybe sp. NHM501043]